MEYPTIWQGPEDSTEALNPRKSGHRGTQSDCKRYGIYFSNKLQFMLTRVSCPVQRVIMRSITQITLPRPAGPLMLFVFAAMSFPVFIPKFVRTYRTFNALLTNRRQVVLEVECDLSRFENKFVIFSHEESANLPYLLSIDSHYLRVVVVGSRLVAQL